jgi:hypothetical protein
VCSIVAATTDIERSIGQHRPCRWSCRGASRRPVRTASSLRAALSALAISSSSFPHYSRNLNTGMNSLWTSEMAVARQTILHDEEHPSRLVLTVAPGVRAP